MAFWALFCFRKESYKINNIYVKGLLHIRVTGIEIIRAKTKLRPKKRKEKKKRVRSEKKKENSKSKPKHQMFCYSKHEFVFFSLLCDLGNRPRSPKLA